MQYLDELLDSAVMICSDLLTGFRTDHYSYLRTNITDKEVLVSSLRHLGFPVLLNARIRGYYGKPRIVADVVALLAGRADIGWNFEENGRAILIADLYEVARPHSAKDLVYSIQHQYKITYEQVHGKPPPSFQVAE